MQQSCVLYHIYWYEGLITEAFLKTWMCGTKKMNFGVEMEL